MSKVAIKGASTGTGTFTIESPATNTDRVLVLPDNAGTVLTSASDLAAANLSGRVAAANAPLGSVIQVVNVNFSTFVTSTSSTETDTGITASITPTSTSSTIVVIVQSEVGKFGGNAYVRAWLYRNSTQLIRFAGQSAYTGNSDSASNTMGTVYRDSPNTTSPVTYKVTWANPNGSATIEMNPSASVSTMLLMEIAG
jgi:hypothetical protein